MILLCTHRGPLQIKGIWNLKGGRNRVTHVDLKEQTNGGKYMKYYLYIISKPPWICSFQTSWASRGRCSPGFKSWGGQPVLVKNPAVKIQGTGRRRGSAPRSGRRRGRGQEQRPMAPRAAPSPSPPDLQRAVGVEVSSSSSFSLPTTCRRVEVWRRGGQRWASFDSGGRGARRLRRAPVTWLGLPRGEEA